MTKKINGKIVGYAIKNKEDNVENRDDAYKAYEAKIIELEHELERLRELELLSVAPEQVLFGRRYHIPPSASYAHSFFVNINDVVSQDGLIRPFEIFIYTQSQESMQWINALARTISAIFRRERNLDFIGQELKSIFDPRGGYYRKGGSYKPSIVSEIGEKILEHIENIKRDNANRVFNDEEMVNYDFPVNNDVPSDIQAEEVGLEDENLKNASFCSKCNAKAVVILDKCPTCLECGDSKCG